MSDPLPAQPAQPEPASAPPTPPSRPPVDEADIPPKPLSRTATAAVVAVLALALGAGLYGAWWLKGLSQDELREMLSSQWAVAAVFGINVVSYLVPMMAASGLLLTTVIGALPIPWADKFLFAAVAGVGQSLGELGGYFAGVAGRGLVADHPLYRRAHSWIGHHESAAFWFVWVNAAIPNVAFKFAGLAAGALKMPLWRFLLAVGTARIVKNAVALAVGSGLYEFCLWLWPF